VTLQPLHPAREQPAIAPKSPNSVVSVAYLASDSSMFRTSLMGAPPRTTADYDESAR
jgi:hypothetical protein